MNRWWSTTITQRTDMVVAAEDRPATSTTAVEVLGIMIRTNERTSWFGIGRPTTDHILQWTLSAGPSESWGGKNGVQSMAEWNNVNMACAS